MSVREGLVYRTLAGRELTLDPFVPREGAAPFPLVVFILGNRTTDKIRIEYADLAMHAVRRGEMAVVIIE